MVTTSLEVGMGGSRLLLISGLLLANKASNHERTTKEAARSGNEVL
jgi:hypothetical protein